MSVTRHVSGFVFVFSPEFRKKISISQNTLVLTDARPTRIDDTVRRTKFSLMINAGETNAKPYSVHD